ncbi:hypothetical protein WN51_14089 [Melipona quadrifasciata]|uniref:Uncharacterized protein n=1 Tax=Melipona quadrifasciata TaxID=166423 RepID=A0A0M9A1Q0_9HYME|nr:hypothetical protein WN51_14089 [Melipona quadrifasciata]
MIVVTRIDVERDGGRGSRFLSEHLDLSGDLRRVIRREKGNEEEWGEEQEEEEEEEE